jgi:hypothetical protein
MRRHGLASAGFSLLLGCVPSRVVQRFTEIFWAVSISAPYLEKKAEARRRRHIATG